MSDETGNSLEILDLTTDIVCAYVSNNQLKADEVTQFIVNIHKSLEKITKNQAGSLEEDLVPAISIKKSIQPDYLVCLEDGKKFKSLKRHLRTHYNLSPEEYREKWSLPIDYPMVAPNYAAARSKLAKKMGLGQQRKP